MEAWEWITIAVLAGLAVVFLIALFSVVRSRRRRAQLQETFGPEYYRAVSAAGRKDGERHLDEVVREHETLEIRPLTDASRDRYLDAWRQAELRFVSDPRDAARAAEAVVVRVLADRGYPTEGEVERQAAHVGVDHPDVAERYRHGHAMLEQVEGKESTENLRKAMIDFRAVLDELVGVRTAA
jgi:hypothetical protein